MATAADMLNSALRKIGEFQAGETVSSDISTVGLALLNTMLDAWQIERLMVYSIAQISNTWPAATTSRTIGSGGNFTNTRPKRIDSAFVQDSSGFKYPIEILRSREPYDAFTDPTSASTLPEYLFYDPDYPLGVIYLYPVPSAAVTLLLNVWETLQSFALLTTALDLPPGYQRAIEFNLAVEWAHEFGRKLPPEVIQIARESKAAVRSLNLPEPIMTLDAGIRRDGYANILTGT